MCVFVLFFVLVFFVFRALARKFLGVLSRPGREQNREFPLCMERAVEDGQAASQSSVCWRGWCARRAVRRSAGVADWATAGGAERTLAAAAGYPACDP